MKTSAFTLFALLALLTAGCSDKSKPEDTPPARPPTLSERTDSAVEKSQAAASDAIAALNARLAEWKLTPSDIKADLEKSGRVVRDRSLAAGEKAGGALDNARIVAVVKGKYVADRHLSALKINVDADQGVVTLNGPVGSLELAGRAIALALDTEGVTQVIGLLKIDSAEAPEASSPAAPNTM
jgi:osmotically-inducible protein OsmY